MINIELIFDIETNHLDLLEVSKIHTMTIYDISSQTFTRYDLDKVSEGIKRLSEADVIIGHNVIFYDIPVIKKLYPDFTYKKVIDTLVWARLVFADIKDLDAKTKKVPGKLFGSHSLKAYGYRLGVLKGTFPDEGSFEEWSQEMSDYCEQDVRVTLALYERLQKEYTSKEAFELEHKVAFIIQRQIAFGINFDRKKAEELYVKLVKRKQEIRSQLVIPPWKMKLKDFVPKRDNKAKGYKAGVPIERYKTIEFNPSSRQHIQRYLKEKFSWEPKEFTEKGQPKIDEEILTALPFEDAKLLVEHFVVEKRLGQLGDGEKSWLKLVKKDGKIHGEVITNGAVTGRMTHQKPNVSQVPAVRSPYGQECRELFTVPSGFKQVGVDAKSLELRCLAHYMAKWDGGKYAKIVVEGDVHSENQKAAGLPTRDDAKTFIYALLYGAGDEKIGSIVKKGAAAGKQLKKKFFKNIPALNDLKEAVAQTVKTRGYLIGLDGRRLKIRSAHSALNVLLQSAGAILMKKALVIADEDLQAAGLKPGIDYEFIINSHDERQYAVREGLEEFVGKTDVEAIKKAGEYFKFRCPLDGEYKIGRNWAECH